MTSQKQLKVRVRARMARTGERYATARRQVVVDDPDRSSVDSVSSPVVDHGWSLRGGTDPDASALANVLANRGVHGPDGPISEALVFGISGGLGAGYILWEFAHDDGRHVTLGFGHRWNYLDARLAPATERLGIDADWSRAGGVKAAGAKLRAELTDGNAVVVWPDRFHVGYWHVPQWLDGHGGHPVVAYAVESGRVHVDDRNLSPLTVDDDVLDRARARVGTYKNAACVVRSRDMIIDGETIRTAIRAGLLTTIEHLSKPSDSFSLPAWRKWARMLTDQRNAKAWPKVFGDRRSLLGGLLSVWEGVEPAGTSGGSLRGLFAGTLAEAADLLELPALAAESARWREIDALWHGLAEAAAPDDIAEIARARELTAAVTGAVAEGDEGEHDRASAADELWRLRASHVAAPPFEAERDRMIFAAMAEPLTTIFEEETAAVERLKSIMA